MRWEIHHRGKRVNKVCDVLYHTIRVLILALFLLVLLYLFFLAGFPTSVLDPSETILFTDDSIFRNLLAAAAVIFACCLLAKVPFFGRVIRRINGDPVLAIRCRRVLLAAAGASALIFVLSMRNTPMDDQLMVMSGAGEWLYHQYNSLQAGGYASRYHNQLGIMLLIYLASHVLGPDNYMAFKIVNVIALVALYRAMADLSDLTGHSPFEGLAMILAGWLFTPLILYTDFVYGTIIGLSCAVNAVRYLLRFEKEHRALQVILFSLLLFGSVAVKSNYYIFLIAIVLYILIRFLRNRDRWILLPLVLSVCIGLCSDSLITRSVEALTGVSLEGSGIPSTCWVVMGLRDDSTRCAGWYDGYTMTSYEAAGADRKAQEELAAGDLAERLQEMKDMAPGEVLDFFSRKMASMWNNPDFGGIWVNARGADPVAEYPCLINRLLNSASNTSFLNCLNRYQFVILAGALLYLIFCRKRDDLSLFFFLTVLGGFVFHSFWEAKSQYALPYFTLLIPLAVDGYRVTANLLIQPEVFRRHRKLAGAFALSGVFLTGVIGSGRISELNVLFLRQEDTETVQRMVADSTLEKVKDGNYHLSAAGKEGSGSSGADVVLHTSKLSDRVRISVSGTDEYLTVREADSGEDEVIFSDAFLPDTQQWSIHRGSQEDTVTFVYQGTKALTGDIKTGEVSLTAYDNSPEQQWHLTKTR